MIQKITPFLLFNGTAEEAMSFYVSIFKNSKITSMRPGPDGKMFTGTFELDGQPFMVLNGGPIAPFTEAISLFVHCEDQAEVDMLWDKLVEGGQPSQCGWLKDKFGVSWQIIPKELGMLLNNPDHEKAERVMQAMLKMTKIDTQALKDAAQ